MSKKTSFRNARKKNFTQISNELLNDEKITLEAKSLLTIFLSNTEDWKIQMKEIITRSKNGRDAHYRVLDELIEHGYIARVEIRNSNGKFENQEYVFSDDKNEVTQEITVAKQWAEENEKQIDVTYCIKKAKKKRTNKQVSNPFPESQDTAEKPFTENQDTVKQDTDNRDSVNQYINNTNRENTNRENTNRENINSSSSSKNETNIKKEALHKNEQEEEELVIKACNQNMAYQVLGEFLHEKGIESKTINKIILELIERNLDIFMMEDIEKQYAHMMEKKNYGERIYNFAVYFVNGLVDLNEQSLSNRQYQQERLREYEIAMKQKEERKINIPYYNWLEE